MHCYLSDLWLYPDIFINQLVGPIVSLTLDYCSVIILNVIGLVNKLSLLNALSLFEPYFDLLINYRTSLICYKLIVVNVEFTLVQTWGYLTIFTNH